MVAPSPPKQLASNELDRLPALQNQNHDHQPSPNRYDGSQCCYEPLLPAIVPWSTEIPWLETPNTSSSLFDTNLMEWPVSAEANQVTTSQLTGIGGWPLGQQVVQSDRGWDGCG
ncbi:hypothetical protein Hanom_Chr16g01437311 [Helianthus anomalus]